MDDIALALVLNLHQPHGNLDDLLSNDLWAANEILYALDRIPRSLWPYPDKGRVHLSVHLPERGVLPPTSGTSCAPNSSKNRTYDGSSNVPSPSSAAARVSR